MLILVGQNVMSDYMSFHEEMCPREFMNVAIWEHGALDN
jgi:hypothetical protein